MVKIFLAIMMLLASNAAYGAGETAYYLSLDGIYLSEAKALKWNGIIYIPLRTVAERKNMTLSFSDDEKTVTLNGITYTGGDWFTLGSELYFSLSSIEGSLPFTASVDEGRRFVRLVTKKDQLRRDERLAGTTRALASAYGTSSASTTSQSSTGGSGSCRIIMRQEKNDVSHAVFLDGAFLPGARTLTRNGLLYIPFSAAAEKKKLFLKYSQSSRSFIIGACEYQHIKELSFVQEGALYLYRDFVNEYFLVTLDEARGAVKLASRNDRLSAVEKAYDMVLDGKAITAAKAISYCDRSFSAYMSLTRTKPSGSMKSGETLMLPIAAVALAARMKFQGSPRSHLYLLDGEEYRTSSIRIADSLYVSHRDLEDECLFRAAIDKVRCSIKLDTVRVVIPRQADIYLDSRYNYGPIDRHAAAAPPGAEKTVQSLAKYLASGAGNEREKARAIFWWIAAHIDYDVAMYRSRKFGDLSAEGVLRRRTAVCEGYAALFRKLAILSGLECAKVTGYAKGAILEKKDESGSDTNHAWNAVKIDGKWRLVDATWGAGHVNAATWTYTRSFDGFWFFTPPDAFVTTHLPEHRRWQLLATAVSKAEFLKLPGKTR
ncbi:MAG: transglutaminase domain-containing protein [Candidatus Eremiobacteraeota bacterium]|nr:transglutaminase domain-containing protein [Candidatus Eremiobacteraeota bacterium]